MAGIARKISTNCLSRSTGLISNKKKKKNLQYNINVSRSFKRKQEGQSVELGHATCDHQLSSAGVYVKKKNTWTSLKRRMDSIGDRETVER